MKPMVQFCIMFRRVPQSSLPILRVPQEHPLPLKHPPPLKNPTRDVGWFPSTLELWLPKLQIKLKKCSVAAFQNSNVHWLDMKPDRKSAEKTVASQPASTAGFHAPSTVPTQQPAAFFHSCELRGTTLYRARRRVLRPWFNFGNGEGKAALRFNSTYIESLRMRKEEKSVFWSFERDMLKHN